MYKCLRCGEPHKASPDSTDMVCDRCGSRMFVKERPNVRKKLIAR